MSEAIKTTSSENDEKINESIQVTEDFVGEYCNSRKGRKRLQQLLQGLSVDTRVERFSEQEEPALAVSGSRSQVDQTKMRIAQALLNLNRQISSSFTHLITIPFTNNQFMENFYKFKNDVLTNFSHCFAVDDALFQNPKKLHLTVACLTLETSDKLELARENFKSECDAIIEEVGQSLRETRIEVRGLEVMNTNPRKTNVLFAKIENDIIQVVANRLVQRMARQGLVHKSNDPSQEVKLHITLMNTLYRRRKAWRERKRKEKPPAYFDSTELLDHYKDFVFCNSPVALQVQINELLGVNEHGYYRVVESRDLITNTSQ